jgi:hypothetical protein
MEDPFLQTGLLLHLNVGLAEDQNQLPSYWHTFTALAIRRLPSQQLFRVPTGRE